MKCEGLAGRELGEFCKCGHVIGVHLYDGECAICPPDMIEMKGTTKYGDGYSLVDEDAKKRPDPTKCRYLDCTQDTYEWLMWESVLPNREPVRFPVCELHGRVIKDDEARREAAKGGMA